MPKSDLLNALDQRPDRLAEVTDPADVLAALQKQKQLSAQQVHALDYAISHWVTQTLSRAADTDSLLLLDALCALFIRRAGTTSTGLAARLDGWRTLLENKRLAVQGLKTGRVRQLLQTAPVRRALASGEMTQAQLAAAVGVSAGRISQLLNVMEEAGLVQRHRVGRESRVSLPLQNTSPAPTPMQTQPAPKRADAPVVSLRGSYVFTQRAAA
jgi:DNA-binding transcriptional ArsR family regulator